MGAPQVQLEHPNLFQEVQPLKLAPWPDVRPRKKTSGSQVTGSLPKKSRGVGCFQGTKNKTPDDVINNAGLQRESA